MIRMTIDTKLQTKHCNGLPAIARPLRGTLMVCVYSVSVVPGHHQPTERIDRGSPIMDDESTSSAARRSGGRRLLLGPALCQGHDLQETHANHRRLRHETPVLRGLQRVAPLRRAQEVHLRPNHCGEEANFSLAKTHVSQHMRSVYAGGLARTL